MEYEPAEQRKCPYTYKQISEYLDLLGLSEAEESFPRPPSLQLLKTLHQKQLVTVPFENLALHYSTEKRISLDPQKIFDKFVNRRRGGNCMELNLFFRYMLAGLGFRVYSTGARGRRRRQGKPEGDYYGWTHMINIVSFPENGSYVVDVGFGGPCSIHPVPLSKDVVTKNLSTQEIQLAQLDLPSSVNKQQKSWVFQARADNQSPWRDYFTFSELEFLPQDFDVINHYTCTHPDSFHVTGVYAVGYLSGGNGIQQKVTLADAEVKFHHDNGKQTTLILKNEEDRIGILRKCFNISLSEEEIHGVRGTLVELRDEKPTPNS